MIPAEWRVPPGSTPDRRRSWAIELVAGEGNAPQLVGRITLRDIQSSWCARLGIYLHPDYYNRGIGTAALRAFLAIAPVETIWLDVSPDNQRAIHCYHNVGFTVMSQGRSIEMCIMTPLGRRNMQERFYASSRAIADNAVPGRSDG
jgi:RimJ/RimL family protein N-acetyltransferase